jgi:diacylglycerol O-acyltransferase / wax synthase
MTAERLSALDMAFLCLESAAAPMHLGAVAVFDGTRNSRAGRVVALLDDRARRVPRLRQRIRQVWLPPGGAEWADDPAFDVGYHVRWHSLRSASVDDLAAESARLMADPLDLTRPPWQVHVITGLAGERFAVVAKFHHALCDAYGAIGLSSGLLDAPDGPHVLGARRDLSPPPPPTPVAGHGLVARAAGLVAATAKSAPQVASQALTALGIASSIAANARLASASPLLAASKGPRRVILAQIGAADVRHIRRLHGGTVHDVLLAIVTGALRQWLVTRGHLVNGPGLRALIPASQRRRSSMDCGGNLLSGYLCDLPVSDPDPARRLQQIRTTMDRRKAAGPRRGAGALPVLASLLPHAVHRLATPLAGRAAGWLFDLVITTVPLPATQMLLGGALLRELYPLVPLAHGHALGIALSHDRDTIHIGIHADLGALPDIDKLAEALPGAIIELAEPGHRERP